MSKVFFSIVGTIAAAGVALGGTTLTYDELLQSPEEWTFSTGRRNNQIQIVDGIASCPSCNWGQAAAVTTLSEGILLTNEQDTFTFSFDITTNGTTNAAAMVSFVGETAICLGMSTYNGSINYGTSANVSARAYSFQSAWDNNGDFVQSSGSLGTIGVSETVTVSGAISWKDGQFVLDLSANNETGSIDLGDNVSINNVLLQLDGPNNVSTVPSISNLSMSAYLVPEPATASRSLLGLAGLAMRRRRRQEA